MPGVKFPFGAASVKALTAEGDQEITIDNMLTILDGVTTQATNARNLVLSVDKTITAGARILLKSKTNGIENTVFKTGCTGATFAGAAGKTKVVELMYDGANFIEVGTPIQID